MRFFVSCGSQNKSATRWRSNPVTAVRAANARWHPTAITCTRDRRCCPQLTPSHFAMFQKNVIVVVGCPMLAPRHCLLLLITIVNFLCGGKQLLWGWNLALTISIFFYIRIGKVGQTLFQRGKFTFLTRSRRFLCLGLGSLGYETWGWGYWEITFLLFLPGFWLYKLIHNGCKTVW
jgi:hypothetical protein